MESKAELPVLETIPCPAEFSKFYCLNNSDCFVIQIQSSFIYNCECTEGYVGQRCEFKHLDQSYLRERYNAMIQQATLTSAFIILLVLIILFILILYLRRGQRRQRPPRSMILIETAAESEPKPEELNIPFSRYT